MLVLVLSVLSFLIAVLLTVAALAWLLLLGVPAYRHRPGRELDLILVHEMTYVWHVRTERLVKHPVVGEAFEAAISLSPAEAQGEDREVPLLLTETTQLGDVTVGVVAIGCDVSRVGQTHNRLSFGEEIYARFAITPRQPGRTNLRFELRIGERLLADVVDPVDVRTRVAGVALPRRIATVIGVVVAIIGWLHLVSIAWSEAREVLVGLWGR
jgi:hypothetical protein